LGFIEIEAIPIPLNKRVNTASHYGIPTGKFQAGVAGGQGNRK
jgi:hypothetical protein